MGTGVSQRSRFILFALAGGVLALLLAHHPVLLSGLRLVQGDEGDVRFNHYVLEHGWRFISGDAGHARFWDPPMFHPEPNVSAYSDVLLGVAPFYWLWRLLGLSEDVSWQAWLLTMSALNYAAALWLLMRGFALRAGPAVVGAVLFTAGAPRINQLNHPQLTGQFFALLALGAVLVLLRPETDRRRGVAWSALLVGAFVAQLYAGFYWGWFLFFFLLLGFVLALGFGDARRNLFAALRRHLPALAAFGVVGLALLVPLVLHSRQAIGTVGLRDFSEVTPMVPRVWSWFYVGPKSWLYGWTNDFRRFQRLPLGWEHQLGFGFVTSLLAAVGLWQARARPAVRMLLVMSLVTVLLVSFYRGGLVPWWLVFKAVPGAAAIRALARVGVWMLIPASIGLALFLQRQVQQGRAALAAGLGALCLLEQGLSISTYDRFESRADVDAVASRVGPECRSFFYAPTAGEAEEWKYQLDGVWASVTRGVPTVNGYSGNAPRGWKLHDARRFDAASAERVDQELASWMDSRALTPGSICRIEVPARR
ncbi:hypothetical protein D7Y13_14720 [Corallococcus praedator]|uniref:Glycosyltransferase RgtA/B/C/D-like domain-containing protein n=1 Tax=Corallococcus praedator TaxID=2316724 RepID=A0ABX9QKN7_9BACT|nr:MULTISPECIES: hypothetical protein [Corallococcus]RKH32132.1 hypothetical protein D7X75_16865 [Corallococcus sp. CA031C]RKI09188.1 hypothetical protein D7Y13_14720 [Corallococcus praedator]